MTERQGGHCDLCHKALEIGELIYVHGTPSTGTYEEARASKDVAWFEDPHWAACKVCHTGIGLLDSGLLTDEEWVIRQARRSLRNQVIAATGLPPAMEKAMREAQLKHVVDVLASFARHHVPEFYTEVNEGV